MTPANVPMNKLLKRLGDVAKSGVYRAPGAQALADALRGSPLGFARVDFGDAGDKEACLERIARALSLPDWFGGNWDALEEALADRAGADLPGQVLVFEGAGAMPAEVRSTLQEILLETAQVWKARHKPFVAVFVSGDPAADALPELYRSG